MALPVLLADSNQETAKIYRNDIRGVMANKTHKRFMVRKNEIFYLINRKHRSSLLNLVQVI